MIFMAAIKVEALEEIIKSRFLQRCDIPSSDLEVKPFTLVVFGGAGDLTQRQLMPSLFHLFFRDEFKDFSILGCGLPAFDDARYREEMEGALKKFDAGEFKQERWGEFSRRLFYLPGDFEDDGLYHRLIDKIYSIAVPGEGGRKDVIFYMAVPAQLVPGIVSRLKAFNLTRGPLSTKVIIEKPFGHDGRSARALNSVLKEAFNEEQIYRIDHYLSKEPVQNILFFRFTNVIFEKTWSSSFVNNVQITVAESIGVGHRGRFYEETGVVRDIVQNHLLQLAGLVAMEPPVGFNPDYVRDEKAKVFESIRPYTKAEIDSYIVRGQYGPGEVDGRKVSGYRQENDVSPGSNVPTFFAGKFYIDNLRWAGVPFYLRTGKCLARRVTEVCLQFKQIPLRLMGRTCDTIEPNVLVLSIQPEEKIMLRFGVKYPYSENQVYFVDMVFDYKEVFKTDFPPPYERLILDCMRGDLSLFVRQDSVEVMWSVVDPIIERWDESPPSDFPNYAAGSWGPTAAEMLLGGRRWVTG